MSSVQNLDYILLYWLVDDGILIIADYNPHISRYYNLLVLYTAYNQGQLVIAHISSHLVGGFSPCEKYARQIGSSPKVGVKIKKQ